jgi:hypothetical protein
MLRQAAADSFKDPADLQHMKGYAALDPLQGRGGFRELFKAGQGKPAPDGECC